MIYRYLLNRDKMKTPAIHVLIIGAFKNGETGLYAALRKELQLKVSHCSDIPVQESLLAEKRPDIVLVDLVRRDFSVLEIFKMIQDMALTTPVIYLGNPSQIDQLKIRKKKPEEVIAIIKKGLKSDFLTRIIRYEFDLGQKEKEIKERKVSDENLKQQMNLLMSILKETKDTIFVKDLNGKYLIINDIGAANFNKTPAELIGHDNYILNMPEETARKIKESDREVIQSGEFQTYEIELMIKGEKRFYLSTKSPYRSPAGKIEGVIGITRDITERKNMETQLRSEHAYRKPIEDAMRAGVAAADLEGRLTYVNPAFCKMVGWEENELLGLIGPFPFWPAEEHEYIRSVFQRKLSGVGPKEIEYRFQRKNGERFDVLVSSSPLTDGHGHTIGIVSTFTDITELKTAKTKLEKSLNLLQSVIEGTTDSIYVRDLNGHYLMVNSAAARFLGKSVEDLVEKSAIGMVLPETARRWKEDDQRVLASGRTETFEIRIKIEGKENIYLTTKGPVRDNEGNIFGIFGVSRDITEKKKAEEELLKVQKLESLGLLAGGIAHDFNNILTGIIGNISLAGTMVHPQDELFQILKDAELASDRASSLARQLLTFAKGGEPVKTSFSIKDLIEREVQFSLSGSNVQGRLDIPNDLWPVNADSGQISQVIQNLVINAKQAMPEGGMVFVRAKNLDLIEEPNRFNLKNGQYICVTVSDTGPGIPKKIQSKIFDPYFSTKQKGSGLGLSIVYSILKKHSGTIFLEPDPGNGASFQFLLPAGEGSTVRKSVPGASREIRKGNGFGLIIDDDATVLKTAGKILKQLGYKVETALSSTEGIEKFKAALRAENPFEFVITDLTLPGDLGGEEILRQLKEIDPQIKVIVSSGYSNDPVLSNYKTEGFSGYIKKPYRVAEMSEALNNILNS